MNNPSGDGDTGDWPASRGLLRPPCVLLRPPCVLLRPPCVPLRLSSRKDNLLDNGEEGFEPLTTASWEVALSRKDNLAAREASPAAEGLPGDELSTASWAVGQGSLLGPSPLKDNLEAREAAAGEEGDAELSSAVSSGAGSALLLMRAEAGPSAASVEVGHGWVRTFDTGNSKRCPEWTKSGFFLCSTFSREPSPLLKE